MAFHRGLTQIFGERELKIAAGLLSFIDELLFHLMLRVLLFSRRESLRPNELISRTTSRSQLDYLHN